METAPLITKHVDPPKDLTGTKTVGVFSIAYIAFRTLMSGRRLDKETLAAGFSTIMCLILQCVFFAAIIQTTIGDYEWTDLCPTDTDWGCRAMFLAICGFYTNRAVLNLVDVYDDKLVHVSGSKGMGASLDFAHEALFSNAVYILNLNLVGQQTSILMIFFKTTTFEWLTKMDDGIKSQILGTNFKETVNENLEEVGSSMFDSMKSEHRGLLRMLCNLVTFAAPIFFTGVAIRSVLFC